MEKVDSLRLLIPGTESAEICLSKELKEDQVAYMDPSEAMKRPVGILRVKVLKAMTLKRKHLFGASDRYVELKLTEDKHPPKKTSVKHSNLNPEWNEEFSLFVKDPQSQALEISVCHWKQVGIHNKMGINVVPLQDLPPDEPKVTTLDLRKNMDPYDVRNEKSRGQTVLELVYKPFRDEEVEDDKAPEGTTAGDGLLVVVAHEAENLEGKNHTNPYVRLRFRQEERKTKRMKKNRDPRWEEEFQFKVEDPAIDDGIHVEVISTSFGMGLPHSKVAAVHKRESLGRVVINLAKVVINKRIKEKYPLIGSKNGRIQIELQWRAAS